MLTKAQIIWSLVAAMTGTTAYQAYENRRELFDAAQGQVPVELIDSLEALAPPDPKFASPDFKPEDTAGLTAKLAGYLDSARGTIQRQNTASCEGYCRNKRDKCVQNARHETDLTTICYDEHEVCYAGCHAGDSSGMSGAETVNLGLARAKNKTRKLDVDE